MVNDINGPNTSSSDLIGAQKRAQQRVSGSENTSLEQSSNQPVGEQASADKKPVSVELSQQAQDLKKLQDQVAQQDGVDSERVQQLKADIAAGRYQVNAEQVANKLIDFEGF
ncbi:flagellar biosynthesis anti-sigma factor FlgM [Zooshikella marina]|uniref:Negative regulator of flagellin synthesis n=1 Tax=Zooshikella ganghwensis TaxID=202772 RepID=A0A4P9VJ14_9GAMM|nr:flagellar biosynthesis anti-sigma factor FlgM [Zooshikella ganghwensis]MBU2704580.1 flagellar biosynthesis anti-sigma factor FlgM [Zooshikella ganghwensis]RDH43235.1 flagellar biosynthesis anti-sigma factor FlgM [Zooshikella ganghwensis]